MINFKKGPNPLSKEDVKNLMNRNSSLVYQDYDDIQQIKLENIISRQATINIVVLGHVTHGRSKMAQCISKKQAIRFHHLENSPKLSYSNAKIYKCLKCPQPKCFQSFRSNMQDQALCQFCSEIMQLQKHIALIDSNMHALLMAKILSNTIQLDNILLVVAANKNFPEQQAKEQLALVGLLGMKNMIIVQNKIDLVFNDQKDFIQGTLLEDSPIIPVSAFLQYNIDYVLQQICSCCNAPPRQIHDPPLMIVFKSFDNNKLGDIPENIIGAIVQGTITSGVLSVGDEISIKPVFLQTSLQEQKWGTLTTRIVSLKTEENDLLYAVPGGQIDVGLLLDPSLARKDRLAGCVIVAANNNSPGLYTELDVLNPYNKINYYLLKKMKTLNLGYPVKKIRKGELLKFSIWAQEVAGIVLEVTNVMKVRFRKPVCINIQERVAISRRIRYNFKIIGWGYITDGQLYE